MTFQPNIRRGAIRVRANANPKAAVEDLIGAFSDFKTRYDKRLDGLEAGIDDIVKANAGRLVGGAGAPRGDDAASSFFRALSTLRGERIDGGEKDYENYKTALAEYFRKGDGVSPDIRAELSVGSNPDGGYLVVPERSPRLIKKIHELSPIRAIAGVETTRSDSLEFIVDHGRYTSGGWIGETESRSETATGDLRLVTIYVREQFAQPIVTQKLLDDGDRDIASFVVGKVEETFAITEGESFVNGEGVNEPRGFLDYKSTATTDADAVRDWGKLQYVATGTSGGFPAADPADILFDLQATLKPAYRPNARWIMNRAVENVVRKFKDGDGRYIWSQGNIADGQPNTLMGYPITLAEDMPDIAADSFSIAFGDFEEGYAIVDRIGMRILRDPYTTKGKVKFYGTKRVGGDVVNFDAIKLLKFATS